MDASFWIPTAISCVALVVSVVTVLYSRQQTQIARSAHQHTIRPHILGVLQGSPIAREEPAGVIGHRSLAEHGGAINAPGLGIPIITAKYGPAIFSVLVYNAGSGTALIETARMLLPGTEPSEYEKAQLVGEVSTSQPPGSATRIVFIEPEPDVPGYTFAGFIAEIVYSNIESTATWRSRVSVNLGANSGKAITGNTVVEQIR